MVIARVHLKNKFILIGIEKNINYLTENPRTKFLFHILLVVKMLAQHCEMSLASRKLKSPVVKTNSSCEFNFSFRHALEPNNMCSFDISVQSRCNLSGMYHTNI